VKIRAWLSIAAGVVLLAAAGAFAVPAAWASGGNAQVEATELHPTFQLLDASGENVLETGNPISTMETCGACHDAAFIAEHNGHAQAGLESLTNPGSTGTGRDWEFSDGYFGSWDPLVYRVLSLAGDPLLDLGTADWVRTYGVRHVGGGPAAVSSDGEPLSEVAVRAGDPQTHVLDPETQQAVAWDWVESGTVELNCFLCHSDSPNDAARRQALLDGRFAWANTATLVGTGVVEHVDGAFTYLTEAFDQDGNLNEGALTVRDPANENCGLCHGLVHDDVTEALVGPSCDPSIRRTVTTGQIVSPERIDDSGMNLANKAGLTRSWDIHSERRVECTDCHFSLNNPAFTTVNNEALPESLVFDPRRLEPGEYLYQPSHELARAATTAADGELPASSADRCQACHSLEATHDWLPYKERHVAALACETCHVPSLYANAMKQLDWTVLGTDGRGIHDCRGVVPGTQESLPLVTGYEPVWLDTQESDGTTRLAPYNLVTFWYWVYGDPPRPVRQSDLEQVWLAEDGYAPDIVARFDADGDGELESQEIVLDTPAKVSFIAARLQALGLDQPRIVGDVQPYAIHHAVATETWAIQECDVCHGGESRINQPFTLSSVAPGSAPPGFVGGTAAIPNGTIREAAEGGWVYEPGDSPKAYVLGLDRVPAIDSAGAYLFALVLLGVAVHGSLRFYFGLRHRKPPEASDPVYMYGFYERLWHWLQTIAILLLLLTGLIIHRPAAFPFLDFRNVVIAHNILAAVLVINAGLALFYHLASGEIRQYLPRPIGFFDQAILQAKFYLRGIFRREAHPFAKLPQQKLNPLQQVTYLALLNILLPLQIITGALMWGAQRWPEVTSSLGGLGVLAPVHTAVAWLLAAFILLHVYLTTTGATPVSSLRAMMLGWEQVESGHAPAPGGEA
jgi:thiosulfate reductase cytochrome b subunit